MKHESGIVALTFSQDGSNVLTGGSDNTARLWSAQTGAPRGEPLKHDGIVHAVAFSPNGQTVLTGSWDKTARLWDARTGAPQGVPLKHDDEVWAVAFSPDAQTVLTISGRLVQRRAQLWNAQTNELRGELVTRRGVAYACFSPNGKSVAVGSFDGTAQLWDTEKCNPFGSAIKHAHGNGAKLEIVHVAFSPDGSLLLTGSSEDRYARLWDVATGDPYEDQDPCIDSNFSMWHREGVNDVAFTPDGRTMVTRGGNTARLWNARTGVLQDELEGVERYIEVSPDSKTFMSLSEDQDSEDQDVVRLWTINDGVLWDSSFATDACSLFKCHWSQDGQTVLTTSLDEDRTLRVWNAVNGELRCAPLHHEERVIDGKVSPEGQTVLSWCGDGMVRLWNVKTGELSCQPLQIGGEVRAVAFSPDGKTVLVGGDDQMARVWGVPSGVLVCEPLQIRGPISAVAFSPDGQTILTGSQNQMVRFWSAETGALLMTLNHEEEVGSVAFSPDGRTVLTVGDFKARWWDSRTGALRGESVKKYNKITDGRFSPDSQIVLTINEGGLDLWDARTGKSRAHLEVVALKTAVAFSPDGRRLWTGDSDGIVQGWDTKTGFEVRRKSFGNDEVIHLACSPDCQSILMANDSRVAVWDARTGIQRCGWSGIPDIRSVVWSPNSESLLIASNFLQMRNVPPPAIVDQEHPNRLRLSVETRIGKRLTENGVVQPLTFNEWNSRRLELDKLGGPCDRPTWEEYQAWKKNVGSKKK
jgi:WD40 repeat protein